MATLIAIRAGIATALGNIAGLQVNATATGTIDVPAAVIMPASGEFVTYGATINEPTDDWSLTIMLFVSRADDLAGQAALDAYIAPTGVQSIAATIQANQTLAGLVDDCNVSGARSYGTFEYNSVSYFGCEFPVRVLA